MDLYNFKRLEWDIRTFQSNTTRIADMLANYASDLEASQNISNDEYTEIYALTTETDDLAKSIVDKLTDYSDMEEDPNPSFTSKLLRSAGMAPDEKKLESEFKAAFELFQRLHRQVMERQRVAIASLRSSIALSGIQEPDAIDSIQITPALVSEVFRPNSENSYDGYSNHEEQSQLLLSGSNCSQLLGLMLEKKRDLEKLETQAVELHSIQTKLAVLSKKHGEVIDTIEDNIADTEVVVVKANDQLNTAIVTKRKMSRRKCIIIIIIIVAILALALLITIGVLLKQYLNI